MPGNADIRLGAAIMIGDAAMFRETLDANPDMMYYTDVSTRSWLHYAISQGRTEIMRDLLSRGFDVNLAVNIEQVVPLTVAVNADFNPDRADMVRTLLAHGADPNLDRTLITAINPRRGDESVCLELVKLLVEAGADINRVYDIYGDPNNTFTALESAEARGLNSVADYLRSKGATARPDRPPPAPPPGQKKRK